MNPKSRNFCGVLNPFNDRDCRGTAEIETEDMLSTTQTRTYSTKFQVGKLPDVPTRVINKSSSKSQSDLQ